MTGWRRARRLGAGYVQDGPVGRHHAHAAALRRPPSAQGRRRLCQLPLGAPRPARRRRGPAPLSQAGPHTTEGKFGGGVARASDALGQGGGWTLLQRRLFCSPLAGAAVD